MMMNTDDNNKDASNRQSSLVFSKFGADLRVCIKSF